MRKELPFILHIARTDPFAEAAIELTAALEELHRLPQQEARERIAGWKWREHEEPVGRDAEEYIDLLALSSAPILGCVFPGSSRASTSLGNRFDKCSADL